MKRKERLWKKQKKNEASMGNREAKRRRAGNEVETGGKTEKDMCEKRNSMRQNDWQRNVEVEQNRRNKSLQDGKESAHRMQRKEEIWMIKEGVWYCSEVLVCPRLQEKSIPVCCYSSLFLPPVLSLFLLSLALHLTPSLPLHAEFITHIKCLI